MGLGRLHCLELHSRDVVGQGYYKSSQSLFHQVPLQRHLAESLALLRVTAQVPSLWLGTTNLSLALYSPQDFSWVPESLTKSRSRPFAHTRHIQPLLALLISRTKAFVPEMEMIDPQGPVPVSFRLQTASMQTDGQLHEETEFQPL